MPASQPTTKPVIGIIGAIGSGKSAVSGELAALGCAVIDADAIGHKLLGDPEVRDRLRQRWGDKVLTDAGDVDRAAIADAVFASRDELDALNGILHPLISAEMTRAVAQARADESIEAIVLDAALLMEAGWDKLCSCVIFVDAPEAVRLKRVVEQRKWDPGDLASREKMQISLDIKRSRCDYLIDGSSSVSHLRQQVLELYPRIIQPDDGFGHNNRPK